MDHKLKNLKYLLTEFQDIEFYLTRAGYLPTLEQAIKELMRKIKALEDEDLEREDDPKFGEEEEIPDGTEDIDDYD